VDFDETKGLMTLGIKPTQPNIFEAWNASTTIGCFKRTLQNHVQKLVAFLDGWR